MFFPTFRKRKFAREVFQKNWMPIPETHPTYLSHSQKNENLPPPHPENLMLPHATPSKYYNTLKEGELGDRGLKFNNCYGVFGRVCRDEKSFSKNAARIKREGGCFLKKKNFGGENQTSHFLCSFLSAYNFPPSPLKIRLHHIKKTKEEKPWISLFSQWFGWHREEKNTVLSVLPRNPGFRPANVHRNQSLPPRRAILDNVLLSLPSVHSHVPFSKNHADTSTPAVKLTFSKR